MKTKLIFDYDSSKRLQYYLYAKGEIIPKEDIDDSKIVHYFGYDRHSVSMDDLKGGALDRIKGVYGIDTMLASLCMFDEIQISSCNGDAYMNFDGDLLDGEGKFQNIGVSYENKYKKPQEKLIQESIDVLRAHRSNIIDAINRDDCFMHLRYVAEECGVFEMYIENKMYIDALDRYRKHSIKDFFDRLDPLSGLRNLNRMRDFWDEERYVYEKYLDECFLHIYNVMSTKNGYALSSCFNFPTQGDLVHFNEGLSNHEQVSYMAKLNFNKKILPIPQPSTLREVEDFRRNPDWISFREVYAQWISYLQDGDINAFAKMKNDVIKAHQAMDKLDKYKKADGNILTRMLFLLGGEIPYVSEILSIYGFITATKVDAIERKNRWCNIPVFQKNMDLLVRSK